MDRPGFLLMCRHLLSAATRPSFRFSIGYGAARRALAALVSASLLAQPAAAAAGDDETRLTNVEIAEEAIRGAVREALNTLPAPQGDVRLFPLGTSDVNALVESILIEELAARGYPVEVATPAEAAALGEADAARADEGDAGDAGGAAPEGGDDAESGGEEGAASGAAGSRPAVGLFAHMRAAQDSIAEAGGAAPASASGGGASSLGGPVSSEADVTAGRSLFSYRVTDFSFRYADIYRKFFVGPRRIRRLAKVDLHLRLCEDGGRRVVWSENVAHSVSDVIPHGAADLLESGNYAFAKPERTPGVLARVYEPLIVGGIVGGLVFLFYSNQSGD